MVKKCVFCKARPSPLNKRTFHRFPKDDSARQKWIDSLHLRTVINCKTSYLCSDHFDEKSFSNLCDARTRLSSDAVPKMTQPSPLMSENHLQGSNVQSNTNYPTNSAEDVLRAQTINISSPNLERNDSQQKASEEADLEKVPEIGTEPVIANETQSTKSSVGCTVLENDEPNTKKRKKSFTDMKPVKKVRFMNGYETEYICREDFKNEENWQKFMRYVSCQKKKTGAAHSKNLRKQRKINTMKGMIDVLNQKDEFDAAEYLKDLPAHVRELLVRMKERKSTVAFPNSLKTFARTLHFYSPAAYEMVRRSFMKCLPCIQTLNNWICAKDYNPGISQKVIDNVADIVQRESAKGKKLVFNVTFDEIHIKRHREWDKNTHSWKGLVDLGGQLNEINKDGECAEATKALVFMLVNINGGFKASVAHYLINSLNGVEKSILLKDLLIKLHEKHIQVVSVTFDGDRAHKTCCEALGANLNYDDKPNFKPYFEHPGSLERVYIFYDPCHCLKLVRNHFAAKGPITYDGREYIHWSFIKKLNEKQLSEKLHCACKISNRHVYFYKEKMKVFLAAQVLSNSVSSALHFLEFTVKDNNFENSAATANFCKNFNDMFDLLNVRSRFCKTPGRMSITKDSLDELTKKVDEYVQYIDKLEINVQPKSKPKESNKENEMKDANMNFEINREIIPKSKPKPKVVKTVKADPEVNSVRKSVVLDTSVNTGFLGFIICLKNLYSLANDLLNNDTITYLLSYKLSQDHVEMFFSAIRRQNGFNNNPTTTQYKSAYRKLLTCNLSIVVSANANCSPLDQTLLISEETSNFTCNDQDPNAGPDNLTSNATSTSTSENQKLKLADVIDILKHDNYHTFEHNYSRRENENWLSSEYADEIIKHTAGAVVRIINGKIHCDKCRAMIDGSSSDCKSKLTVLKNRGGLKFAADDVNFICKRAEQIIRQQDKLFTKNINARLIYETLKNLPSTILEDDAHFLEQEPLMDHRSQVILLIVQTYVDIRLKHEGKTLNEEKRRIRINNNKMTIFSGQ